MVDGHQPLTDSQWQVIIHLLPVHRKRRHCLRQVVDAMRYICRTGCQWRSLPMSFPPWSAVDYYFRRWQLSGLWQRLNEAVVQADRLAANRPATPSLVCLASQSVRLAPRIFEHRGRDGGKNINGRKRQIVTDVQGRILACRVHAANGHDGVPAAGAAPRLGPAAGDGGHRQGLPRAFRPAPGPARPHALGRQPPAQRRAGLRADCQPLGRRAHLCLAHQLSPTSD